MSSNSANQAAIPARFTKITRTGPYHPDALKYQSQNSHINYEDEFGNSDINLIRDANQAHNADMRARHAADPDMNTGTHMVDYDWRTATHGAKPRPNGLHLHRLLYEEQLDIAKQRRDAARVKKEEQGDDVTDEVKTAFERAQKDVEGSEKMLELVEELDEFLQEIEED